MLNGDATPVESRPRYRMHWPASNWDSSNAWPTRCYLAVNVMQSLRSSVPVPMTRKMMSICVLEETFDRCTE